VFHSLSKENIGQILDLAITRVNDKLADRGLTLVLTQRAKDYLVEKGFDAKFGARPLLRTIQRELEDPLAAHILASRYNEDTKIKVDLDEPAGKLKFSPLAAGKKEKVTI